MKKLIVMRPGEGEDLSSGKATRHNKVDLEGLHLTEHSMERSPMGGLHTHQHIDAFYVLEGELEVAMSATETVKLGPGSLAVAPPGAVHAFGVPEHACFLNIHAPGVNFVQYLRELVALHRKGEKPTKKLFERYDIHDV